MAKYFLRKCKRYFVCRCIPQRISVTIFCMFGTLIHNGFWSSVDRLIVVYYHIDNKDAQTKGHTNNGFTMLHLVFSCGYVIMIVPAGILADKIGGKVPYLLGMIMTSTISLALPIIIIYLSWSMQYTFVMILGMSKALSYPAMAVIVARWTPFSQRCTLGGFVFSAEPFGMSIGYIISWLIAQYDYQWFSLNIFWGVVGIVWSFLFAIAVYDSPQQNPWLSNIEKEMLEMEVPHKKLYSLPLWREILKSRGVWALMIAQLGHNTSMFIVTFPMLRHSWWYYKVHHYNGYKSMTTEIDCLIILCSFFGMWLTSISTGALVDRGIAVLRWNISATRIIPTCIAFLVPITLLIVMVVMSYDQHKSTALYMIAVTMKGPYFASLQINYMDITANFCGVVISLICLAGEVGNLISIAWVTCAKIIDWTILFWTLITIGFVSILSCALMIQRHRPNWDLTGSELNIHSQGRQRVSFNIDENKKRSGVLKEYNKENV